MNKYPTVYQFLRRKADLVSSEAGGAIFSLRRPLVLFKLTKNEKLYRCITTLVAPVGALIRCKKKGSTSDDKVRVSHVVVVGTRLLGDKRMSDNVSFSPSAGTYIQSAEKLAYVVGNRVLPVKSFDLDPSKTCAAGIHAYLNETAAEDACI